jgi:hypothetical protein
MVRRIRKLFGRASEESAGSAEPASAIPQAATQAGRLNSWLTLGANLGVVLGLIILIVEVRQNAALTRAQMETGKNDLLVQIELSLASPEMSAAWVKSIRQPERLTDVELRMVESHLVAVMLQWSHMFHMQESGLISADQARQHIQNVARYYFGSRHGKNWWRWQEEGWAGTPMMEVAGPIVDGLDENFMLRYLEGSRVDASADAGATLGEVQREAQHFMDDYGEELRRHDRAGLAARYSRSGATVIFNGERNVRSFDEIEARYREHWSGPVSFEWRDLSYDVLTPDSVVVTGEFEWGIEVGTTAYAYAGVLQRQQGQLRIRAEVESSLPAAVEGQP